MAEGQKYMCTIRFFISDQSIVHTTIHVVVVAKIFLISDIFHALKGQYRHNQSRLSTGHGIGVLVQDEHSD